MDIKYQIIDTESLKNGLKAGYWSYQWRNENQDKAKMIEIVDDSQAYSFYKNLIKANRSMYNYSINYDKTMINAFLKFVEKGIEGIPYKLRRVNDYIITGNINYFKINREFWHDNYFGKFKDIEDHRERFEASMESVKYNNDNYVSMFLEEFPYLLGQSTAFKKMNIIDIPKMLYYFSIRKDGIIRPSISLKNIQLYEEQTNITHDFKESDISKYDEKMLEDFRKYSLNDVDFLFRYFQKKCLPIIKNRIYAIEAIRQFNPEFEVTEKMIHSETNTELLVKAFSIKKDQNEEEPKIEDNIKDEQMFYELDELTEHHKGTYEVKDDEIIPSGDDEFVKAFNEIIESYEDKKPDKITGINFNEIMKDKKLTDELYSHIKPTGYKEFDELVNFVKDNNHIKKDKKLKEAYCEFYDIKYNGEDEKTIEFQGKLQTIVDKFNEFNLFGVTMTVGLGGIHGATPNYKGEKLVHLDYVNLYPSIILLFKQYYKRIININLYETLYNYRNNTLKPEIEILEAKLNNIYTTIENNGNDLSDIKENEGTINDLEEKINRLKKLEKGIKLLLNSLYGLINSEFNFSISNKILGRFICLYGQYKSIELCKKIKKKEPKAKMPNINTDGIIIKGLNEVQISKICNNENDGYIKLGVKYIDKLIQFDVNNYIKITGDILTPKGTAFKTDLKQAFVRFEKLPCNVKNALKYINNESNIEILPIYFHQKSKTKSTITLVNEESSKNKVYYLTNKDNGQIAVKHIQKPILLTLGGEYMYFTTDKEKADIKEYIKFARITQERILNFEFNKKDNIPYYSYKLIPNTNEEEVKNLNREKLKLGKLFDKNLICINGFQGSYKNILTVGTKPIDELSNYNMTEIRKSSEIKGLSLINNTENMVCLTTNNKKHMEILDKNLPTTFKVFHISGVCLYVYKLENQLDIDCVYQLVEDINVLTNTYIPVFTLDGEFINNNVKPKLLERINTKHE